MPTWTAYKVPAGGAYSVNYKDMLGAPAFTWWMWPGVNVDNDINPWGNYYYEKQNNLPQTDYWSDHNWTSVNPGPCSVTFSGFIYEYNSVTYPQSQSLYCDISMSVSDDAYEGFKPSERPDDTEGWYRIAGTGDVDGVPGVSYYNQLRGKSFPGLFHTTVVAPFVPDFYITSSNGGYEQTVVFRPLYPWTWQVMAGLNGGTTATTYEYEWRITQGTSGGDDNTTWTKDEDGNTYTIQPDTDYILEVKCTDDVGRWHVEWRRINLYNEPPVAVFYYQNTGNEYEVTVNAQRSYDPDGTVVAYSWEFVTNFEGLDANDNVIGDVQGTASDMIETFQWQEEWFDETGDTLTATVVLRVQDNGGKWSSKVYQNIQFVRTLKIFGSLMHPSGVLLTAVNESGNVKVYRFNEGVSSRQLLYTQSAAKNPSLSNNGRGGIRLSYTDNSQQGILKESNDMGRSFT